MLTSESVSNPFKGTIEKRGNRMLLGAIECTIHIRAARGIWPRKTAEEWAAAAGVQPRMAKYWLAGTRPVSADGILALIRLLN